MHCFLYDDGFTEITKAIIERCFIKNYSEPIVGNYLCRRKNPFKDTFKGY